MLRYLVLLALGLLPLTAHAAPRAYDLQPAKSEVAFTTIFSGGTVAGSFPIRDADVKLDLQDLENCAFTVHLDIGGVRAEVPFAADAIRSASILDARRFPEAEFVSTRIRKAAKGAVIEGRLKMHGVTQPVTLSARIMRQQGTAANDLSHLTVHLTGTILRSDFGATGYADLVADRVALDITARVAARN